MSHARGPAEPDDAQAARNDAATIAHQARLIAIADAHLADLTERLAELITATEQSAHRYRSALQSCREALARETARRIALQARIIELEARTPD